jgi:CBS domain-containing protein
MSRVILEKIDTEKTPVSEVMTAPIIPIDMNCEPAEAIRLMLKHHIRHLPVVDAEGKFLAMLSIRHLLRDEVEILRSEAKALENYAGYDGATG